MQKADFLRTVSRLGLRRGEVIEITKHDNCSTLYYFGGRKTITCDGRFTVYDTKDRNTNRPTLDNEDDLHLSEISSIGRPKR